MIKGSNDINVFISAVNNIVECEQNFCEYVQSFNTMCQFSNWYTNKMFSLPLNCNFFLALQ